MLAFVTIVSYAALATFVAALVLCAARRWRLAATLAASASLASLIVVLLLIGRFFLASRGATDPSSRAIVLTVSLSELMNCGALPALVAIAGALLSRVASRRR